MTYQQHSGYEDGPVTVLVEFSLSEPDRAASLARAVADGIAESFSGRPGFLSASLLVSTDGRRMVNVARWASEQAWRAATASPNGSTAPARIGEDPQWLHSRTADEPVARILADGGATLERVAAFHEVQSVAALT
ncbi:MULTISPECIES: antibiotic biosynthesis monooxygenase family protein [Mycobacteriaceae]|uniref:Antibiotic biosynthesis monooxygenase family protein n=1 Tax=Mycolicibacterium austroafricanum TaxID=39687 RepID=A0ABT8H8W6_MYCAO|nr:MULTISPECIES: antibiotic biosynthesis monooxygenase family protein [Mycobacteriaceae]MDN4517198.1 antibiotic biosynthesis monooxygenase family protein [Mycolicibacterium austroafricanum]